MTLPSKTVNSAAIWFAACRLDQRARLGGLSRAKGYEQPAGMVELCGLLLFLSSSKSPDVALCPRTEKCNDW